MKSPVDPEKELWEFVAEERQVMSDGSLLLPALPVIPIEQGPSS